MKLHILIPLLLTLLLANCTTGPQHSTYQPRPGNLFQAQFVSDQITPKSQTYLWELLLTLPVFKIEESKRRPHVYDNAVVVSPTQIKMLPTSSQKAVSIKKLPAPKQYQLRYRNETIQMKREKNGWLILSSTKS